MIAVRLLILLMLCPLARADSIQFCFEDQPYLPYLSDPSVASDNKGLLVDLVEAAASMQGISISLERMPWKRCLRSLEQGTIDAAFAIIWTQERDQLFAYPMSNSGVPDSSMRIWRARYEVFAHEDMPLQWDGSTFSNVRYGLSAPKGYVAREKLESKGLLYENELNPDRGFKLVSLQRLDGYIVEKLIGLEALKRLNIDNVKIRFEQPYMQSDWFVAFSKQKYAQNKQLVETFWQQLRKARNDNETKLIEKYNL
jgi:polar amino acid transport system substrate-binding protein